MTAGCGISVVANWMLFIFFSVVGTVFRNINCRNLICCINWTKKINRDRRRNKQKGMESAGINNEIVGLLWADVEVKREILLIILVIMYVSDSDTAELSINVLKVASRELCSLPNLCSLCFYFFGNIVKKVCHVPLTWLIVIAPADVKFYFTHDRLVK